MQPAKRKHLLPILGVILLSFLLTLTIWWGNQDGPTPIKPTSLNIFSPNFPNHPDFISEISLLKSQGKLKSENEKRILDSIYATSPIIKLPPSLLYCLLFQESRLNHLLGVDTNSGALGLGQFSYYSFFEVNNELSAYSAKNLVVLQKVLGYDVRPIVADAKDLSSVSSYFHIPTAVAASAIYLNNRYNQLTRIINKRQIHYDRNLLWIFAAMAYNKGTRSILSLWNQTEEKNGVKELEAFLSEPKTFVRTFANEPLLTDALKRIWEEKEAKEYAKEWKIHASNILRCSTQLQTAKGGE